jgi:hypothetical protein
MIDESAAFSVFRKWRDAESPTTLRVDATLGVMSFSFECTLMRVDEPLVGFLLDDCGFIEFRFDSGWGFDFVAADAARAEIEERIGDSPLGSRRYEFGEVIVAIRGTDSRMLFLEIVRNV